MKIICDKCDNQIKIPSDLDITQEYVCPHCNTSINVIPTKPTQTIQIINNVGQNDVVYVKKIPKSACAIWSLVLLILAIPMPDDSGKGAIIVSLICVFFALKHIDESNGKLAGKNMAITVLIIDGLYLLGSLSRSWSK